MTEPRASESPSFEHDLAAILGAASPSAPVPARRSGTALLAFWPVVALAGAGLVAFVQLDAPPSPRPGIAQRAPVVRAERPAPFTRSAPADEIARAAPFMTSPVAQVQTPEPPQAQRQRSDSRRDRATSDVSYQAPRETAMFAQAGAPPADKDQTRDERESRVDTEQDKQRERARVEALDAVRALRLR